MLLLLLLVLVTYPERGKSDEKSHDIGQHVIGVSDQSQRVGDVTEDDFTEKERESQTEHRHHSTCLGLVPTQPIHSDHQLRPFTFQTVCHRFTSQSFTIHWKECAKMQCHLISLLPVTRQC